MSIRATFCAAALLASLSGCAPKEISANGDGITKALVTTENNQTVTHVPSDFQYMSGDYAFRGTGDVIFDQGFEGFPGLNLSSMTSGVLTVQGNVGGDIHAQGPVVVNGDVVSSIIETPSYVIINGDVTGWVTSESEATIKAGGGVIIKGQVFDALINGSHVKIGKNVNISQVTATRGELEVGGDVVRHNILRASSDISVAGNIGNKGGNYNSTTGNRLFSEGNITIGQTICGTDVQARGTIRDRNGRIMPNGVKVCTL